MSRKLALAVCAVVLSACSTPEAPPSPAKTEAAPVSRQPLETPAIPPRATAPGATGPAPQVVVPPNTLYVCVVQRQGRQEQTAIEFEPKVGQLCAKHPEMGPCQYERNHCRAGGGRVFAANGQEITMATEAEYDKKVMRVRFRAN